MLSERSGDISVLARARPRVRVTRVAEAVAGSIRELILRGDFRDGERLPRVEALTERFGVAASAVREAISGLLRKNLIRNRFSSN